MTNNIKRYRPYYGFTFRPCSVTELSRFGVDSNGQEAIAESCDAKSICSAIRSLKRDPNVSALIHVAFKRYLLSAIPAICEVLCETSSPKVAAVAADRLGSLGLGSSGRFRRQASETLRSFVGRRIQAGPDHHWDNALINAIESGVELDGSSLVDYATAVTVLSPDGISALHQRSQSPALVAVWGRYVERETN